jgi:hypothetical protein
MSSIKPAIKIEKLFSRRKDIVQPAAKPPPDEPETDVETDVERYEEQEEESSDVEEPDDDLDNLTNSKYTSSVLAKQQQEEYQKNAEKLKKEAEKAEKEAQKENERMIKELSKKKRSNGARSAPSKEDTDSLFDDKGSEILGKNKRVLLNKVKQYKNLFPEELKGFKIKKNPTEKDLEEAIEEMSVIVDTSTVDQFLIDAIFQVIKVIEGISANTKSYNITGLADILKANKQFHTLAKQLFIKYGCYSNIPPEYQMVLIVATSAYICRQKNMKKGEIEKFLNQPITITTPPTPSTPPTQPSNI